ncbi:rho guanine nucleotide exchange factor 26-like isoform X2 [Scleropages formosus]|uniref:rho guanine nucleotide exchange factor 26-like isoform X2 n=1 Tax=Scleropages formosus TaxID=113540 RepID=UPI0010FAA068|nr:rho guanine nucleotide exchange factor 26 isoform X2 [Scleropages formosus]
MEECRNEVDLLSSSSSSNNNIAPLWKRRAGDHVGPRGASSSCSKPRPVSYQVDGVLVTDFPVEEGSCGGDTANTAVLRHVLSAPVPKSRVVRSISIGHSSRARRPLSKSASGGEPPTAGDRVPSANGGPQAEESRGDPRQRLSVPVALVSQTDRIVFGSSPESSDRGRRKPDDSMSVVNNNYLECWNPPIEDQDAPSTPRSSSISSGSSMSCTPSDPPTPTSPFAGLLLRQGAEGRVPPGIVLSTNSPAALKMGTQQLIPRGLASNTRLGKAGNHGNQEPAKRAQRVRSMVETGSFSMGGDDGEDAPDSPGALRRGLRSTSYRRAMDSRGDLELPGHTRSHRLSQPVLRDLQEERELLANPGKSRVVEKRKPLPTQRTFDGEEDEVLYQNYQEKALHNDSDEDAEPKEPESDNGIVVQYRSPRISWSQLSVVRHSRVCESLTPEERKRQEAIFELISSEHSYLHSLEILIRMFKDSPELDDTMNKTDKHHLFSNIVDVCEASKKFFKELEERHNKNVVIEDISDIVEKHALWTFEPYVTYCSNEMYQQRTLQRLITKNPAFKEVLARIESHPDCGNLPMISFLILPMQRVTRLPLLMDTICQKTSKNSSQFKECKRALQAVSKLVRQCNEGARRMERTEMMYTINSQLDFKIKAFPLVSSSRWLVKRGELTAFVEENNLFMKRTLRQQVYLFLFNDVLIVTRKKSEENYTVLDYALRDKIQVELYQAEEMSLSPVRAPASMLSSRQPSTSHMFQIRFPNIRSQEVSMVLGAEQLNERARWISALTQSKSDKNADKNAPKQQVEVVRAHMARQPDELSLQVADVVLVSQAVEDGQSRCRSPRGCNDRLVSVFLSLFSLHAHVYRSALDSLGP